MVLERATSSLVSKRNLWMGFSYKIRSKDSVEGVYLGIYCLYVIAIQFVLSDEFSHMRPEERQQLLHVSSKIPSHGCINTDSSF